MPTYIAQADIEIFFPDLNEYGLTTVNAMIDKAETDVINYYTYIWFPQAYTKYLGGAIDQGTNNVSNGFLPAIDLAFLNTTLLKNLFIYKTLGYYLFPSMMKTTVEGDDSFFDRGEFYRQKYDEELALVQNAPIYDFTKDGQFNNLDVNKSMLGRIPKIKLVRG